MDKLLKDDGFEDEFDTDEAPSKGDSKPFLSFLTEPKGKGLKEPLIESPKVEESKKPAVPEKVPEDKPKRTYGTRKWKADANISSKPLDIGPSSESSEVRIKKTVRQC